MLIWMKHMDAPTIGSAETWRVMRKPMTLASGTSTGYGLGLVTMPYRGLETLSHGGGVLAGNSQMIKVPAAKLDISIASNRADVSAADLANRIIDACIEDLPSPETGTFDRRTGVYVSASGRVAELNEMGDMQLVGLDGGPPVPMHADARGVLQLPDIMLFLQQQLTVRDEGLRLAEFGHDTEFQPVERDQTACLGNRSGSYRSPIAGMAIDIEERDEGAIMTTRGAQGSTRYKLEPITKQVWKATTLGPLGVIGAIVTFADDVRGLELTAGRMPALRFERTVGATT